MKISSTESGKAAMRTAGQPAEKILPKERPNTRELTERAAKAQLTPLERGILAAQEALSKVPDIRQEIVGELKAKIESGQYQVSGEEIADMMLRRWAADQIR